MNQTSKKKRKKVYLGLVISVVTIVLLLKAVKPEDIWEVLINFKAKYLYLLLMLYLPGILLRVYRWKLLLSLKNNILFSKVFAGLVSGYFYNNILPAKIGEVIRGEYIKKKTILDRGFIYGTIFIERVIDILFVLLFLILSIVLSKTLYGIVEKNIYIFIPISIILTSLIYFFLNKEFKKKLLLIIPLKFRNKVKNLGKSFFESFKFITNKKILLNVLFISLLIWGNTLLTVHLISCGLNISIPIHYYFFIIAGGTFGMLIPSTTGSIGVYHSVSMSILILLGENKENALAYAVISHALDFFPAIILGIIVFIVNIIIKNNNA